MHYFDLSLWTPSDLYVARFLSTVNVACMSKTCLPEVSLTLVARSAQGTHLGLKHVWCSTKVMLWFRVLCRSGHAGFGSGSSPQSVSRNVTDGVQCRYWRVSFSLLRGADFATIFRPQNLDHFRGSFVIVIEAADEYDPKTVLFLGSVCLRIGARLNDEVFSAGSTSNPKSIGS